jgi:hypothetical protein
MLNRRAFLIGATAVSTAALKACSWNDMQAYEEAAARLRSVIARTPDITELARYATLAANSHNSQPWTFKISDRAVSVLPDFSRRTPAVDPDDHHLHISLGCAAENLLIAARAIGRPGQLTFNADGEGGLNIQLENAPPAEDVAFAAIPKRQSTRSDFDGKSVAAEDLAKLEAAAAEEGVSVMILTDVAKREGLLEHVIAGNSAQIEDPAFVAELKDAIRFNPSAALATGDGLFSACSGNPTLPTWLGRLVFDVVFQKKTENDKYTSQIRSSAGFAIFVGKKADREHWIKVGRSFQRFALHATALGIRHSHLNQPVEVPSVRTGFANWLGLGDTLPDLVIRFGYAPPMPMSMRRPVGDVIV